MGLPRPLASDPSLHASSPRWLSQRAVNASSESLAGRAVLSVSVGLEIDQHSADCATQTCVGRHYMYVRAVGSTVPASTVLSRRRIFHSVVGAICARAVALST